MKNPVTLPKRFVEPVLKQLQDNELPGAYDVAEEMAYQIGRAGIEEEGNVNSLRYYRIGSKEQSAIYKHIEASGTGRVWETTAQIGSSMYVLGCHY
jgi:hypothetical protein